LHVNQPLDIGAMASTAQALLGQHDFLAFGSPPQGENSVRHVAKASWSFEDPWLVFEIEANAFLTRMVRMLVGTMIRVGLGKISPVEFGEILRTRNRDRAGPAVPARGLCLMSVLYAGD
jgi:tRNA pseudouridine38-40 synthase